VQRGSARSTLGGKEGHEWDRISLGEWIEKNTLSKQARQMLDMALAGTYTSAGSETSLLWMLHQMGSGGGPGFVIGGKGGAQDARPVGGMGAIYRPIAAELGDALHLSRPVQQIAQDADGVTVSADGLTIRARRVVVAIRWRSPARSSTSRCCRWIGRCCISACRAARSSRSR